MENRYNPETKRQRMYFGWLFIAILCATVVASMASDFIKNMFMGLLASLMPVIIGVIIAFVFKRIVDFLDKKVLAKLFRKSKKGSTIRRIISISMLFVLLAIVVVVIIISVIPSITDFINQLSTGLDGYVDSFKNQIIEFLSQFEWFQDVDINQAITDVINDIVDAIRTNVPIIATTVLNVISSTATFVLNFLLGMTIAFLILKDKEKIASYSTRFVRSTVSKKRADYLIDACKKSDDILYNYVISKILESLVYVAFNFPGFYLLKVPYPLGMAILFSLFLFIPYFGAYIAMVPITLFTAVFVDLATGLWALVYINVVMTIMGYTISPLIYGKKLRINALLVTTSIIIGGGMFGLWGMLFAPPCVAIASVFINEFISRKEEEKRELSAHNLTEDDMKDLEILEQAAEIVKQKRLKEDYEMKIKILTEMREQEVKVDKE